MKSILNFLQLIVLITTSFLVYAEIETYDSGVFFKVSDEPVSISYKFDNSSIAWGINEEKNDLNGWVFKKDYDNYFSERELFYSHFLYGYRDFILSTDADDLGILNIANHCSVPPYSCLNEPVYLGKRTPLILIHGWQGDNGVNNYLGFNKIF